MQALQTLKQRLLVRDMGMAKCSEKGIFRQVREWRPNFLYWVLTKPTRLRTLCFHCWQWEPLACTCESHGDWDYVQHHRWKAPHGKRWLALAPLPPAFVGATEEVKGSRKEEHTHRGNGRASTPTSVNHCVGKGFWCLHSEIMLLIMVKCFEIQDRYHKYLQWICRGSCGLLI